MTNFLIYFSKMIEWGSGYETIPPLGNESARQWLSKTMFIRISNSAAVCWFGRHWKWIHNLFKILLNRFLTVLKNTNLNFEVNCSFIIAGNDSCCYFLMKSLKSIRNISNQNPPKSLAVSQPLQITQFGKHYITEFRYLFSSANKINAKTIKKRHFAVKFFNFFK